MDLSYDFIGGVFVVYDNEGNIMPPLDYVDSPTEGDTESIEAALFWYRAAYSPALQGMQYETYLDEQNQPVVMMQSVCTADGIEAGTTQIKSITTEADDGTWRTGFNPTSANQPLQFGTIVTYVSPGSTSPQNCWLTFRNVQIPPGARLRKAVLKLTAYDFNNSFANTRTAVNATIKGHLSANSTSNPSIGLLPNDTNFPKTTTVIDWDNVPTWTNNTVYTSPDIACILQEIVNQSGWSSGNAVKIFIENDGSSPTDSSGFAIRSFHSYNSASNKVAQLQYWYSDSYTETMNGGIKVGGDNQLTSQYTVDMTGGIVVGGTFISEPFEVGGINIGGSFDLTMTITETMSGGIKVGGSNDLNAAIEMNGGIKIGGDNQLTSQYVETMNGGIKIGDGYFANGKRYRIKVTIPAGKVTDDVDFFPMMVRLNVPSGHILNSTDFIVTDADDNSLTYLCEGFNQLEGTCHLIYKQNIKANSESVSYIYYGG